MPPKSATKAIQAVPDTPPSEPPVKRGKKKLVLLLIGAVVLSAGGGGAWYFVKGRAAEVAKPQAPKPPVFVNLEPFTVNLQPEGGGDQYLQVVAVLRVADQIAADALKLYMPELRHRTLLLLSSKRASEVATPQGREQLADQLKAEANRIVATATGHAGNDATAAAAPSPEAAPPEAAPEAGPVHSVFFTSFIVQ